jgi:hypothetical protein
MHHTDLPRRQDADDLDAELERRQQRAEQANTEMWHRRLAWGIPVVAIFVALVGVLAILGPPFPSPGQGVRRIAPEVPSAAPTPAPAPGPTSRPCGDAPTEDEQRALVARP